jgi:lipoprotein-anchoring transpeptidase ErfK/SrfK
MTEGELRAYYAAIRVDPHAHARLLAVLLDPPARRRTVPAMLAIAASVAVVGVLALVIAIVPHGGRPAPAEGDGAPIPTSTLRPPTGPSNSPASSPPATSASSALGSPVHVSLLETDGATYGVGMPIVAYFSQNITDSAAFIKATTVSVNGTRADGAWYFEASGDPTKPMAAHYRLQDYWPADSTIKVNLPLQGLSAGTGLSFDDTLTLTFSIGDAHISTVDCAAERMTVTSNGAQAFAPMPTSCGAPTTPTSSGIKVVMQLGEDTPGTDTLRPNGAVRMVGGGGALGNYDLLIDWSVRITAGGEYVHSAPWSGNNIGARSTSDGCTNLSPANAQAFYEFSHIGDVVTSINTGGPTVTADNGFGDWNVAWSTWQAGGSVTTR